MNINLCQKILDADQIRKADHYTIKYEPIASIDLMERSSQRFVSTFKGICNESCAITVLCGTGNNGGDGLAVARLLIEEDYKVEVYLIGDQEKGSEDFNTNNENIRSYIAPKMIISKDHFPVLSKNAVVIDAIFGYGLSRPIEGLEAELVEYVNNCKIRVVALDIASGLGTNFKFEGPIMKVKRTITFQVPKLSLLLPENEEYVGGMDVVDIGLNKSFMDTFPCNYHFVKPVFIQSFLRKRKIFSHKGTLGHNLIIAGSYGKMGAAVLAASANLKTGSGLVTCCIPSCGMDILQTAIPESMAIVTEGQHHLSGAIDLSGYDSIGLGPGIGSSEETKACIQQVIEQAEQPLVIDADALNIIAANLGWLKKLPKESVLTPHPGEFKRIVGEWKDDYERLVLQRAFSLKYHVHVVLKGAYTSISAANGEVFFNTTGNPGMATAGSGDVLTGIITSLIGQGYSSLEAALLGTYIHGSAADQFIENTALESLTARDIISKLGNALLDIHTTPSSLKR
ncbi:MAG: NAD(P)H-hydrate dehydratase [Reichenbachiella sp.]